MAWPAETATSEALMARSRLFVTASSALTSIAHALSNRPDRAVVLGTRNRQTGVDPVLHGRQSWFVLFIFWSAIIRPVVGVYTLNISISPSILDWLLTSVLLEGSTSLRKRDRNAYASREPADFCDKSMKILRFEVRVFADRYAS